MRNSYLRTGIISAFLSILMVYCQPPVQEMDDPGKEDMNRKFLKVNQYLRDKHQDQIEAFVKRVDWDMEVSPTGLWYNINGSDSGQPIRNNSRVSFSYSSVLLDGTPCYEADENNPKTIMTGRGGVEAGVEEALLKMKEGDEATLIIPPHLGHGNFGDRNKIPGNSVIIYKLKVLKVG